MRFFLGAAVKYVMDQSESHLPTMNFKIQRCSGKTYSTFAKKERQGIKPRRSIIGLPIIHPLSRVAMLWGIISTICDLTYTAYLVPLSLAFNYSTNWNFLAIFDLMGNITYFMDMFMNFHVGVLLKWDLSTITVLDGKSVAYFYTRKGGFFVDLLAIAPGLVQIIFACTSAPANAGNIVLLLRLLRLTRVIRIMSRLGKMDQSGAITAYLSTHLDALTLLAICVGISLSILINLMACLWWWIAETEQLEDSWVASIDKVDLNLFTESDFWRWTVCSYFSLTTIATIGYGDITPQTPEEMLLAIIFMLLAVTYFGYLISTVTTVFQDSGEDSVREKMVFSKLQGVEGWMRRRHFPLELKREIRQYYMESWIQAADPDELEYFEDLPSSIRAKVANTMLDKETIYKTLFGSSPDDATKLDPDEVDEALQLISTLSVPKKVPAGSTLYTHGDNAATFFILDEGEMLVPVHTTGRIRFTAPAIIGISALFASDVPECAQRLHSVDAHTNCQLWEIDSTKLAPALLHGMPTIYEAIYVRFIEFIDGLLKQLNSVADEKLSIMQRNYKEIYTRVRAELVPVKEKIQTAKRSQLFKSESFRLELGMSRGPVTEERIVDVSNISGGISLGQKDNKKQQQAAVDAGSDDTTAAVIEQTLDQYGGSVEGEILEAVNSDMLHAASAGVGSQGLGAYVS